MASASRWSWPPSTRSAPALTFGRRRRPCADGRITPPKRACSCDSNNSAYHTYDRRTCGLILDSRRHACPGARRRHWRRRPLRCGAGCTRDRAHRWPERRARASAPQHCAQSAASCSSAPAAGSNTCWWPGGPTVVSGGTCAWKTASGARALQWPAGGLCGGERGAAAVGARPAAALGTLRLGARQRSRISRDERPAGPAKPVQETAAA